MNIESPTDQHQAPANWQPRGQASALRIAAGVMALIAAALGILVACIILFSDSSDGGSTPFNGWMNFFLLVGSIGCLVTGIVIIAKQRKRRGATPWLVASFSALIVISCLGFMFSISYTLGRAPVLILPGALAALILSGLIILKDKSGH